MFVFCQRSRLLQIDLLLVYWCHWAVSRSHNMYNMEMKTLRERHLIYWGKLGNPVSFLHKAWYKKQSNCQRIFPPSHMLSYGNFLIPSKDAEDVITYHLNRQLTKATWPGRFFCAGLSLTVQPGVRSGRWNPGMALHVGSVTLHCITQTSIPPHPPGLLTACFLLLPGPWWGLPGWLRRADRKSVG